MGVSNTITENQLGGLSDTTPGHTPRREDVVIRWSWKDSGDQTLMLWIKCYGLDMIVPGLKSYLSGNLSQTGDRFGNP